MLAVPDAACRFEYHTPFAITSVAVSDDGRFVATRSGWQQVELWDSVERRRIAIWPTATMDQGAIRISPDAELVAFEHPDRTLRVHETSSGRERFIFEVVPAKNATHAVRNMAFSPDSSKLLTIEAHGKTRLWNLR